MFRIPQDGEDPASWLPKPEEFLDALEMASESDAKRDSILFSGSSPMSVYLHSFYIGPCRDA